MTFARTLRATLVVATLAWLAIASPALAAQPSGGQFQISQVGTDGDAARGAENPSAAFNPTTNQALVVWSADDAQDDKFEIFGRFVASDGTLLGGEFRIATAGAPGDATRDAYAPRVAYNRDRDQFLVVWHSDSESVDDSFEVKGQRLGPSGTLLGGEFRISEMGPGNPSFIGADAQVAYNATRDEYVIVWQGIDDGTPGHYEVYGHRVSGGGARIGNDIKISSLRNESTWPTIAYNGQTNEYMVAFIGKDSPTNTQSQRTFVQRLTADAAVVGPNRQIFQSGEVHRPAIVYNPLHNQYLVATPGIVGGETEAYVQRLDTNGVEIGADDQRISHMGPDGALDYGVSTDIAVGFSPVRDEYFVTWRGDTTSYGLVKDENELFGQGLDANTVEIGYDDFPYSSMGPDASTQFGLRDDVHQFTGPLAWAADRDVFYIVWQGDNGPPLADNEFEVWGRMAATSPPPPPPPPPPPVPPPPPPPAKPLPVLPNFKLQFSTSRKRGPGVHGLLYGITGFDALPTGAVVNVRCEKGCKMAHTSFTVRLKRTKTKKRKVSVTFRKAVHLGKNSRIRVTARKAGYRSRYIRYRFVLRKKIGLDASRVGSGCQTPTKPVRNVTCSG